MRVEKYLYVPVLFGVCFVASIRQYRFISSLFAASSTMHSIERRKVSSFAALLIWERLADLKAVCTVNE